MLALGTATAAALFSALVALPLHQDDDALGASLDSSFAAVGFLGGESLVNATGGGGALCVASGIGVTCARPPLRVSELVLAAVLGPVGALLGIASHSFGGIILQWRQRWIHSRPLVALLDVALLTTLTQLFYATLVLSAGCDEQPAGGSLLSSQPGASDSAVHPNSNATLTPGRSVGSCTAVRLLVPDPYEALLLLLRAPPAKLGTAALLRLAAFYFLLGSLSQGALLPGV